MGPWPRLLPNLGRWQVRSILHLPCLSFVACSVKLLSALTWSYLLYPRLYWQPHMQFKVHLLQASISLILNKDSENFNPLEKLAFSHFTEGLHPSRNFQSHKDSYVESNAQELQLLGLLGSNSSWYLVWPTLHRELLFELELIQNLIVRPFFII